MDNPFPREPKVFRPEPFKDAAREIRLLCVGPGGEDDPIVCEMYVFESRDAPPYGAVSYTWGAPEKCRTVTINGDTAAVGHNCFQALWQVRYHKFLEFYWIDTLCIDQEDTQEKNHQVANMDRVFKRAECVYACVGTHANNSEILFDVMQGLRPVTIFERQCDSGASLEQLVQWISNACWDLQFADYDRHSLLTDHNNGASGASYSLVSGFDKAFEAFITAFSHFATRSCWQRVWIMQELYFAREAVVLCATATLPLDAFVSARWALRAAVEPQYRLSSHQRLTIEKFFCQACPIFDHEISVHLDRKGMDIDTLSRSLKNSQCWDPRDRIYGLLAMIADHKGRTAKQALQPNYDESLLDLAIRVLDFEEKRLQIQDILRVLGDLGIEQSTLRQPFSGSPPSVDNICLLSAIGQKRESPRVCDSVKSTRLRSRRQLAFNRGAQDFVSCTLMIKEGPQRCLVVDQSQLHVWSTLVSHEQLHIDHLKTWRTRCHALAEAIHWTDHSRSPAVLYDNEFYRQPCALVPSATKAGDYLINLSELDGMADWAAVVRRFRGDMYELIGPAVVKPSLSPRALRSGKAWNSRSSLPILAAHDGLGCMFAMLGHRDLLANLFHRPKIDLNGNGPPDPEVWMENWSALESHERFSSYFLIAPTCQGEETARRQCVCKTYEVPDRYLRASSEDIEKGLLE